MFVKGKFFVVGDHDDAKVILVLFVNLVNEDFPDTLALVFRAHKQVMHIGIHDAVVHSANHADKLIAVPSGNDGLEILHCDDEFVGEMSRGPFNGEEQIL